MRGSGESETVFIGVPTFNRSDGLKRTIACIKAQSHGDWRMLISDNASSDPCVEETARAAAAADPRITYYRQTSNIGAAANFRFVTEQADAPFFMWASDDDLWEPEFLTTLLGLLRSRPECQMAFSSIDNINRDGLVYRQYPGFTRLNSGASRIDDTRQFINDSEIFGKANLIYGIFRSDALKAAVHAFWDIADITFNGGDVVFLFSFVARHAIIGTDQVLLHKRVPTDKTSYRLKRPPESYFVGLGKYRGYRDRHLAVAPDQETRAIVATIMRRRLLNKFLSRIGMGAGQ